MYIYMYVYIYVYIIVKIEKIEYLSVEIYVNVNII